MFVQFGDSVVRLDHIITITDVSEKDGVYRAVVTLATNEEIRIYTKEPPALILLRAAG